MQPTINKIVLFSLLFSSCSKDPALWEIHNLNNNSISVFGHGGMGIFSLYPIDSKESITEALQLGADGSEMDVQMSSDSVLFLFHSSDLDESTDCSGSLYTKSSAEIDCEYKSLVYNGIKVLPFHQLFKDKVYDDKLIFTFECKLKENPDRAFLNTFATALLKELEEHELVGRCFIESTNEGFLDILRARNKELKLFLYTNDFATGIISAEEKKLFGLTMDMFKITAEQINEAHKKNLRVTLFKQESESDNLAAIQMSPDFIQTDKLKHLLDVLKKN